MVLGLVWICAVCSLINSIVLAAILIFYIKKVRILAAKKALKNMTSDAADLLSDIHTRGWAVVRLDAESLMMRRPR